jgi:hypothetical protein
MSVVVTRKALLEAARSALGPGITASEAIIVGYSQLVGEPLDPFAFDDAAVIARAERLLAEGIGVEDAVATARAELATWRIEL